MAITTTMYAVGSTVVSMVANIFPRVLVNVVINQKISGTGKASDANDEAAHSIQHGLLLARNSGSIFDPLASASSPK
jgi:hypothetical protein